MRRRAVCLPLLLGGLAPYQCLSYAQTVDKAWRIAFLAAGSAPRPGQFSSADAIEGGLRERGYNALQMRSWFADGRIDALPALAQQVLAWQPDLIAANLTPAMQAAQRATRSVPIVLVGSGDPVGTGLVQSLSRPGGNITGVAVHGPELAAKCVELLAELRPGLRRLAVLANAADSFTPAMLDTVARAAGALGVALHVERVREPSQYAAAFEGWRRQQVESLLVQPSLPMRPAADLALQQRWPSGSINRGFVEQGGLLAYVNDPAEIARLAVDTIDRILRGASPATLPVQLSARFDLIFNLRTARTVGIAVPATLLQRATEVIE